VVGLLTGRFTPYRFIGEAIMREWEAFVPEEERKIYEKAGYKGKEKFGINPALIIIDVITGFTGTKPMPVMEAIDEFPTSCGQVAWDALPKIKTCFTPAATQLFQ
jgi:hypothetical protein